MEMFNSHIDFHIIIESKHVERSIIFQLLTTSVNRYSSLGSPYWYRLIVDDRSMIIPWRTSAGYHLILLFYSLCIFSSSTLLRPSLSLCDRLTPQSFFEREKSSTVSAETRVLLSARIFVRSNDFSIISVDKGYWRQAIITYIRGDQHWNKRCEGKNR